MIYDVDGVARWNWGTWGNPGAYLAMQDDGRLVIYSAGGGVLWWRGGSEPAPEAAPQSIARLAPPMGRDAGRGTTGRGAAGAVGALGVLLALLLLAAARTRRVNASRLLWRGVMGLAVVTTFNLAAAGMAQGQAATVEYYSLDALGSVRVVTDERGEVLRRHDYLPFGEEYNAVSPRMDKRLFTGQERDADTGLDYFGARYYRVDLGRFTTIDPELKIKDALVDPQRWNGYAYVANNPLKYTDPDGKNPLLVAGGIGAAVYGGWAIVQNVSHGQPWYNNVGMEAGKGFLLGSTLGLAAPALVSTELLLTSATSGSVEVGFATDRLLQQHFADHGSEFGARSAQEYLAGALRFTEAALQNAKGIEMALRTNGDKLFYKAATNEFLIVTAKGVIRTYFKPTRGVQYWLEQVANGSK